MDLILENKQNNLSNIENQLKIRYGKYYKKNNRKNIQFVYF